MLGQHIPFTFTMSQIVYTTVTNVSLVPAPPSLKVNIWDGDHFLEMSHSDYSSFATFKSYSVVSIKHKIRHNWVWTKNKHIPTRFPPTAEQCHSEGWTLKNVEEVDSVVYLGPSMKLEDTDALKYSYTLQAPEQKYWISDGTPSQAEIDVQKEFCWHWRETIRSLRTITRRS